MISPNQDDRPEDAPIDHLVLHYTGMRSGDEAITRLCDPVAKVSSHYVVAEDGAIHALVPEARRAWHAGVSAWRGVRALNDRSIGIEIVNPGHEWGYRAFPPAQIAAVVSLARSILTRHPIPARNIVAHSDIAPDRKQDPGELFPWRDLAARGIGLWADGLAATTDPLADLAAIGYEITADPAPPITAFQRRFRPARCDGVIDAETAGRIGAITRVFVFP
ncbi:N-acetylmuramoyl-L-alanine amidase [Acidiphilium sp.]|uniref:N-acetylmuramoyl-L-alanine amidase n=1 Tax=Acidiphilium sp. TaxID=527 RepID=UPI003D02EA86